MIYTTLEKTRTALQGGEQKLFVDFTVARERAQINEHLRVIEKAIDEQKPLLINYIDVENTMSERIVEPLAISYQWYAWYLFAFCTLKQDYRLFKLPRISSCEPIVGAFSKEHGNVETLMKTTSKPDKRKYYHVRLLCKNEIRQQALEYLSSNILEEHSNGDFIIEFHAPFERMWFSLLLGFGNQVEVIEPAELKSILKQKAQEILSIY